MRSLCRSVTPVLALVLVLAPACNGDDDDPTPGPTITRDLVPTTVTPPAAADPVQFESGEATVEVRDDVEETFTAPIDPSGSHFDPVAGEYDLAFINDDERVLRLTITVSAAAVVDAFVAVGAPGTGIDDARYFADSFHDRCEVALTTASAVEVVGQFTCTDLENDGDLSIDTDGTFAASAAD
jgi:hypothetical protein